MENNDFSLFVKIILIIGVIFCGLTLITPWISPGGYTWGSDYGTGEWDFFYLNNIEASIQLGIWQLIFFSIAMIITFILSIVALIIGILAIKNIGIGKKRTSLIAGLISIFTAIFFVISISIIAGDYATYVGYSFGFFLMIFTAIIFFISYAMSFFITTSSPQSMTGAQPSQMYYQQNNQYQQQPYPQQNYQQPVQQPPQQTQQPYYANSNAQPQPKPQQVNFNQPQPSSMVFCPQCGFRLAGDSVFCPQCGRKIK